MQPPSRAPRLCYRAVHSQEEDYRNSRVEGTLGGFRYVLENKVAVFFPTADFPNEAEARAVLDPLIRAWTLSALLSLGPGAFELQYCADTPDADSTAPMELPHRREVLIIHDAYPPPPHDMGVNDCVDQLAEVYTQMLRAPENVVRGGRTCLELIERWYEGRVNAAATLNVDLKVLTKLSEITRAWGRDAAEKPRFSTWRMPRWLNRSERAWLVEITREITRRAAQHAAGHRAAQMFTQLPHSI